MTLPTSIGSASHFDQGSDDPKQARAQLKQIRDDIETINNHLKLSPFISPSSPLGIGNGLEASGGNAVVKLDGATLAVSAAGLKLADDGVDLAQLAHATAGDLVYYGAAGVPARLAKGTDGQVLGLASGLPVWQNSPGGRQFVSEATWDSGAALEIALDTEAETLQELTFEGISPSALAELGLEFSTDGSTYVSSGVNYGYARSYQSSGHLGTAVLNQGGVALSGGQTVGPSSPNDYAVYGRLLLVNSQESVNTHFHWDIAFVHSTSQSNRVTGVGQLTAQAVLQKIKLIWTGGATGDGGTLILREMSAPRS